MRHSLVPFLQAPALLLVATAPAATGMNSPGAGITMLPALWMVVAVVVLAMGALLA